MTINLNGNQLVSDIGIISIADFPSHTFTLDVTEPSCYAITLTNSSGNGIN